MASVEAVSFGLVTSGEMQTFAHVSKPDVDQLAGTLAVNSLELICTNDDVAKCSTVLENKDSAATASIRIAVTSTPTIKLLVAHVLGSRDAAGLGE